MRSALRRTQLAETQLAGGVGMHSTSLILLVPDIRSLKPAGPAYPCLFSCRPFPAGSFIWPWIGCCTPVAVLHISSRQSCMRVHHATAGIAFRQPGPRTSARQTALTCARTEQESWQQTRCMSIQRGSA